MATRKDVADLAGVSPAVVSYVLNKSNYVSEEKRGRSIKSGGKAELSAQLWAGA